MHNKNNQQEPSGSSTTRFTEKDVQHIAKLARIKLDKAQEQRLEKELSSVLDFVQQLNEVDTADTEPLYQAAGSVNVLRNDEHRGDFVMDEKLNELLIGQAPHKQERFVKVKTILKK